MPSYQVKQKGYYNGKIYDPEGKRRVITVDKPFDKKTMPSWVEPVKEVSQAKDSTGVKAADLKKQLDDLGVEYKGNASKDVLQELLTKAQDEQNKRDIDAAVSFQEAPSLSGPVETL